MAEHRRQLKSLGKATTREKWLAESSLLNPGFRTHRKEIRAALRNALTASRGSSSSGNPSVFRDFSLSLARSFLGVEHCVTAEVGNKTRG